MLMAEVLPGLLYFSGEPTAMTEPDVQTFDVIVNMEIEHNETPENWEKKFYIWMPTWDYALPVASSAPGVKWLDAGVEAVNAFIIKGFKTLIHCQKGENRSGLLAAAVVMNQKGCTVDEALAITRKNRPTAVWNKTWQNLLEDYHKYLHP